MSRSWKERYHGAQEIIKELRSQLADCKEQAPTGVPPLQNQRYSPLTIAMSGVGVIAVVLSVVVSDPRFTGGLLIFVAVVLCVAIPRERGYSARERWLACIFVVTCCTAGLVYVGNQFKQDQIPKLSLNVTVGGMPTTSMTGLDIVDINAIPPTTQVGVTTPISEIRQFNSSQAFNVKYTEGVKTYNGQFPEDAFICTLSNSGSVPIDGVKISFGIRVDLLDKNPPGKGPSIILWALFNKKVSLLPHNANFVTFYVENQALHRIVFEDVKNNAEVTVDGRNVPAQLHHVCDVDMILADR